MPPHLHPKSRMTMSLFTSTLMVSFVVVAAPHLLPCPVDPRTLADSAAPDALSGEPGKRRRRRRIPVDENSTGLESQKMKEVDEWTVPKRERECPVPKPGGLIGQVLGLKKSGHDIEEEKPSVTKQVERMRRETRSEDTEPS